MPTPLTSRMRSLAVVSCLALAAGCAPTRHLPENLMTLDGLKTRPSPLPVAETLDRLEAVLRAKQIQVFARIDHAAGASAAGLALPPTQVLVFGNPRVGTALMQAHPRAAFDLPLRVLAWQEPGGGTTVAWLDPAVFAERYGLAPGQTGPVAAVEALVDAALR